MKGIVIFVLLVFFGPFAALHSQNEEMALRIKEQVNQQALKNLAKSDKYLAKAEKEKNLVAKFESSRKKKFMIGQIKASKNLGKANWIRYKVYRKDLEKFSDIQNNDSKTISKKTTKAKRLMKQARRKREDALKIDVAESAYSVLKHADEIEEKVFKELYDVYRLLIGKGSSATKDEGLSISDSNKTSLANINPNVSTNAVISNSNEMDDTETELEEEQIADKGIIRQRDYLPENKDDNKTLPKPDNERNEELNLSNGVYFKIQIAASKTELSVDQLTKNFATKELLNVDKEGEWYKYMIRKKFTDYNQAVDYRNNLKIKGAFIIAFKGGNRVSIEEAMSKEKTVVSDKPDAGKLPETNIPSETDGKLIYRLQIGLSFNPLSPLEVSQFKNGGKEVFAIDCGSYFIYTIGEFETENAALNFKKLKALSDADIVKFRNGKLIE